MNDWDLAKTVSKINEVPRQLYVLLYVGYHYLTLYSLSGNMSIALLVYPDKRHDNQDDLKSFFFIILYFTLRFMNHSQLYDISRIMASLFDQCILCADGTPTGGEAKSSLCTSKRNLYIPLDFRVIDNDPLTKLVLKVVSAWFILHNGWRQVIESSLALYNHINFSQLFDNFLKSDVWPTDDKAVDNLLSKRKLDENYEARVVAEEIENGINFCTASDSFKKEKSVSNRHSSIPYSSTYSSNKIMGSDIVPLLYLALDNRTVNKFNVTVLRLY